MTPTPFPAGAVPCAHFEVCGLTASHGKDSTEFCILHDQQQRKDLTKFPAALVNHVGEGRCDFRWVCFPEQWSTFDVILDLSGARLYALTIRGPRTLPRIVRLDGTAIIHEARLEAEPARPPFLRVLATETRPRFGECVSLRNVDLSECCLVGNQLSGERFMFSNVTWADPRRHGRRRWMLYDEVAFHAGTGTRPENIREAYQILKQRYLEMGDNVRSGDFHYGEMEMKRREYGWPWRWVSPEFLYWLSSGYGTRWLQALSILALLVGLFAWLYLYTDRHLFSGSPLKAFIFSLSVATLQRPEIPGWVSAGGRLAYLAESILGPAQIAMLVLALRMRVRR